MKINLKTVFLSAGIILLSSAQAQNFKFKGQIFCKSNTLKGATVEIFDQTEKVIEDVTNSNGKFNLKLKEGKIYMLKASKEKYVTKTIIITAISGDDSGSDQFAFDIALDKEREFRYVKESLDDKPVAHIFYDEKKDGFNWDKDLTQERKEKVEKLKELNKEKRHDKYSKF